MKPTRYSKQREVIYNNVCNRKDHPTAEEIYNDVKKDLPNISLGTVYRNLNLLSEEGKILRVSFDKDIFDSTVETHYHLKCEKCGRVVDVEPNLTDMDFSDNLGNYIKSVQIKFYGICKECKNLKEC